MNPLFSPVLLPQQICQRKKNPSYKHSMVSANAAAMLCLCFQRGNVEYFLK